MGTVAYMSPEQARGTDVDRRTDIWSLGVVLYEMLSGHAPFEGETHSHVIVSILENEPPKLADETKVPAGLQAIVTKALQKDRSQRYQTAGGMALDLKRVKEELKDQWRTTSGRSAKSSIDFAISQTTSSAEHLVKGIKRHKRSAFFASTTLILLVASLLHFSNFSKGSDEALESVAVLPFVNVNNDPNTEYLSEGISDSIINSLSHLPNLKVQSLTSVLRYKSTQLDPQTVGRELSVRAVLIGRMTQEGEDLTISAELVDARDNSRLWSGKYNRKKSDVVVLPNEIAREIAESLRLRLTVNQREQLEKQNTENSDAYLLYNMGNYYGRKGTKEGWEKAIASYEEAIKIDPNFALPYVALAYTYQFMASRGFGPTKEYENNVELAALKALQLDETLAAPHAYLAVIKFNNFDWVGAEKEIKRALELDPSSSTANSVYSFYLTAVGRPLEGLPYAIHSRELDGKPDRGENAFDYYMARQYDKAIELYQKTLEKKSDNPHAHVLLGEAYVVKGLAAEGVAEIQRGIALDSGLSKTPERWDRYPLLAYAYAAMGQRDEALKILSDQKELAKHRYVSPYNFAIIYTGLGDKDQAFAWLSKCVEERTRVLSFHFKSRPLFDSLRSDPRYADLLNRMNLQP
jgi:TolB-like protein